MSAWTILLVGIALGLVLTFLLRRKSIKPVQDSGSGNTASRVSYIRPHVAVTAPLPASSNSGETIAAELERLEGLLRSEALTQGEFDILKAGLIARGSTSASADQGPCRVTILRGTSNKINDIKAVRVCMSLDLKDAKDIVDALPQTLGGVPTRGEGDRIAAYLESKGLTVRVD